MGHARMVSRAEMQAGAQQLTSMPRPISLAEGRRLAIAALLQAEARRQDEREREADFWAALENGQVDIAPISGVY